MKIRKPILIAALSFFSTGLTLSQSGCVKDNCADLHCKNGGACADGYCRCPSGFEGTECEIRAADRFGGLYYGNSRSGSEKTVADTIEVYEIAPPNLMGVRVYSDTSIAVQGFAEGNRLIIAERIEAGQAWFGNLVLNNTTATFYYEHVKDISSNLKTVYSFTGRKQEDSLSIQ